MQSSARQLGDRETYPYTLSCEAIDRYIVAWYWWNVVNWNAHIAASLVYWRMVWHEIMRWLQSTTVQAQCPLVGQWTLGLGSYHQTNYAPANHPSRPPEMRLWVGVCLATSDASLPCVVTSVYMPNPPILLYTASGYSTLLLLYIPYVPTTIIHSGQRARTHADWRAPKEASYTNIQTPLPLSSSSLTSPLNRPPLN